MTMKLSGARGFTLAALVLLTPIAASADDATAHGTLLAQQTVDQWRASKLAGVAVYGPDNKSVGKVTDILMSKSGKAEFVVVGVGGFLGIGEKDVAIPFDAVSFTDEPITPARSSAVPDNNLAAPATTGNSMSGTTASGLTSPGGATPNGGMAPALPGLGSQGDALANPGAPAIGAQTAAMATTSTTYPEHGTIAMTADQLKSAPRFQFAK